MKLTEGAVGFHLGNDGVDKDEEIVLPLAHQHTDFSVGERVLDKRCSEAWVILHIPRSLGDFGNHHVSIALSHLIGDFLVLLPDDDGGMCRLTECASSCQWQKWWSIVLTILFSLR